MLELARAAWRRRKWLAILVVIVPFSAAASLVMFMPNIYESTATILVERQQVPEGLVRPTVTGELETRIRTISQQTLSRGRLDALITRFNLYADLRKSRPPEAIIDRMRADIKLEQKGAQSRGRGSTIAFAISFRGRDPETVAQVTNTLASFYIEENLKARERQATGTAEFLRIELDEARKRLEEQEGQVSEFKKRHVGQLPEQMPANLAVLEQLNNQLRLNHASRLRMEEKRDLLAMQVPEASPLGPTGSTTDQDPAALRLAQLRRELEELRLRFTEKHPDVLQRKAEITLLEQRIADGRGLPSAEATPKPRTPTTLEPKASALASTPLARLRQALGEADAEIKVLKEEDKRLRSTIALYEQRVANTPRREQEFQELSRDHVSTRELYQSLVKRHDEAQLAENMEHRQKGEQFRLLDPAQASNLPAAPNRGRLMLIAFVLSLGLAIGAVVLAEELDTSFHSLDSLRGFTTAPVIATVPRIVTPIDARRQRWRVGVAVTGTMLGLALIVVTSYFFAHGNETLVLW